MSGTPLIPLFAAVTLLFGGANQLSAQLIIAGVLAITAHAAFSPANLSSPYPNFEIYHPEQPPFRDYVLVFGLASLLLVTLISRVRQLPWSLVIAIRRKSAGPQTTTPLNSSSTLLDASTHHLIQHTPQSRPSLYSTSSTSTDQWTATASTLAGASPTLIHPPTGDHSMTSSSEIAALKARMSQLETALEGMKRRSDASTASQKDTASGTTTVVAELSPSHTPPPFLDLDATVPPRTPSPSPSPVDPTSVSKPVFLAEETRQTDQLILKMRNILHANGEIEDISVPPTSSSTQSLLEHLPPSSSADPITPSPSITPSSSLEILRTPAIRTARDALPLPSVVDRFTGTPEFNCDTSLLSETFFLLTHSSATLDLSGFSKVSCSTPVRSANEVEHSTSLSPSSFLNALRSDLVPQALFIKPAPKRSERADAGIRPFSRATSILTRLSPRSTTPRSTYSPLSPLRERSSKSLSLPLIRLGDEPSLGSRGDKESVYDTGQRLELESPNRRSPHHWWHEASSGVYVADYRDLPQSFPVHGRPPGKKDKYTPRQDGPFEPVPSFGPKQSALLQAVLGALPEEPHDLFKPNPFPSSRVGAPAMFKRTPILHPDDTIILLTGFIWRRSDASPADEGFPLERTVFATDPGEAQESVALIFGRLSVLRSPSCPIRRALPLVESISRDFGERITHVPASRRHLHPPYDSFGCLLTQVMNMPLTRGDSEGFMDVAHVMSGKRLSQLRPCLLMTNCGNGRGIWKVEIEVRGIDMVRSEGSVRSHEASGRPIGETAEVSRVAAIGRLRRQLGTARNANGMVGVFTRSNTTFVPPKVGGQNVATETANGSVSRHRVLPNVEAMSTFLRKRPPSISGTQTAPSSSKKQRFIDAVKTLLDIAKESSDVFPPLKGCLGGISALIKHYEEYSDVKDKLNDLAPWVKKLSVTLAQANSKDDHDEVERRSELAKELEEIGLQSMALLAKGKTARVLDKTRDSGEVIKLVERLRQATLVYQVSQQKSIHDKLSQITSSFNALTLSQKSSVEKKIEAVRARLDRLKVDWNVTSNAEELKRRMGLYEALEGIGAKLQLISEQPGATEDAVKEQSMIFAGDLADDLRDVIVEYQVNICVGFSQQNAIYKQNRKLIDAGGKWLRPRFTQTHGPTAELSVLNSCHRAKGAEFRHDDRQGCLKGTREDVLDEIESWSRDFDMSPVYWLNGLAGTGKSTIAQTIAERIFADGRLGASFFCSRDFKDRRDLRYILPTLAFQLAHNYPDFRSIIVPLLQSNPDIAHEKMYNQMETLIAEPLSSLGISTVIVIDALDECADEDPQSAILSVMGRLVGEIPKVKFLITGRPEPRIQSGFRLELLRPLTDVFVLHEVEPSIVNTDIRLFFKHGLCELAKRTGVDQDIWPTDQHLDLLCERAGGLFVYAVATLKFLDHRFTPPNKQLDIIIQAPGSTAYEGNARVKPSTTLDSLYLASFQSAFIGLDTKDNETVRLVVGTVVLAINPLPPSAIATLINLGKQEVMNILRLIHSLLKLPEDPASEVLPFHKSFPDFITNPHRCPDTRFYISPPASHLKLALRCLMLMNNNLEWNLLSLPNYALNSEVMDLEERVGNHISCALQYACRSWHHHLSEATEDVTAIIPVLQSFLQDGFLAWLEVLSVIDATRDAITALEKLMPWLWKVAKDNHLLKTARDYSQFITNFFEVINASATHIYHSALELSPLSSIIRKNYYYKQQHNSPRVVVGVEDAWEPTSATSTKNSYYISFTWSPSGYLLAVVAKEGVEIWDALTLKLLSTLHSSKATAEFRCGLAYSPDGHSLATCFDASIVVWDTQTGGEVTKIHCEVAGNGLELVWSLDGKSICAVSPNVSGNITVHTYDTVSGKTLAQDILQTSHSPLIWACGKLFRIATTAQDHRDQIINIFEVGSTLAKVESFPLPPTASLLVISPVTYRVALKIPGDHNHQPELLILSLHNSEVLLRATGSYWHSNFSPGADLFAAFGRDYLSIWRYTSGHYIHWREFRQTPGPLQFSPSSSSILVCSGVLLHVLNLDHFTTVCTANSPVTPQSQPLDAFSPNGTFIATAHCRSNTIKITNLSCQIPTLSQSIDTELEISAMVLTGNVLLAKSSDKIVAWLLTEEGAVDGIIGNTMADRNDSLWEVSLPLQAPTTVRGARRDEKLLEFFVRDEIAAISMYGYTIHVYHIGTGDVLKPVEASKLQEYDWYLFDNNKQNGCNKYYHDLYQHQSAPDNEWPVSQATLQQGWVKDPEGRCRLWLHPSWRSGANNVDWIKNATTLRLRNSSGLFIVKL
ncbi:hypothetical protein BJ322DRAFT_1018021 [Thelephora terrestris]|uniref:NACHT domain-containing protein n=1 Tax=Thelephora terrestris TaxID=56493 RepID=A0A9P6HKB8_9AGAM|nr:hypothetical protein BJ322DRAFT_1018021 [Thelephora terrestris]